MSRVSPRISWRNFLHLLGEWGSGSFEVKAPDRSLMVMMVAVARREVYKWIEQQSRCSEEAAIDPTLASLPGFFSGGRRSFVFLYLYLHLYLYLYLYLALCT